VFAYVTDPTRFPRVAAQRRRRKHGTDSSTTVGTKCLTTRRIGFAERAVAPPRYLVVGDGILALQARFHHT
jgi:hypothetical protein